MLSPLCAFTSVQPGANEAMLLSCLTCFLCLGHAMQNWLLHSKTRRDAKVTTKDFSKYDIDPEKIQEGQADPRAERSQKPREPERGVEQLGHARAYEGWW